MTSSDAKALNVTQARTAADWARLSPGQEQFWLLSQLTPSLAYGALTAWRIRGPLRTDVLHRSLRLVVGRHEALRVTIGEVGGVPGQVVSPLPAVDLPVLDYSSETLAVKGHVVDEAIRELSRLPFDLVNGPLCRLRLLKIADDEYVLVRHVHQIVTDDWSEILIDRELGSAYEALLHGSDPALAPPGRGYLDYAVRQRECLEDQLLAPKLQFWVSKLSNLPVLDLPADRPRPAMAERGWDHLSRDYPPELADQARTLAERYGSSLYQVLAVAVAVVLGRYTGYDDVAIGMTAPNRERAELRDLVGRVATTIVLRADLSGDPSFETLLGRIKAAVIESQEYQEVPFDRIVDRLRPARAAGRNPLYQVCVRLRDTAGGLSLGGLSLGGLSLAGLTCVPHPASVTNAGLDIAIDFAADGENLRAGAEYSADLFDRWRIEALLGHIETVLRAAVADPRLRVWEVPVVTQAERHELLALGHGEQADNSPGPLASRQVYVVDRRDNLVPKGVAGELLIGGAEGTLASGYRSGDLVRWSRAGQIEFIGRIDNQVNLGGHRVEPGEIERAVQTHPDPVDVQSHATAAEWTATQQHLARCFCDVLSLASVGIDDGFFALGGNSMSALSLMRLISERCDVSIGVGHLFANTTVEALAAIIDNFRQDGAPAGGTAGHGA
jgi:hypothetical protein